MSSKKHYFLVSGEVVFTHPDIDNTATMRLNTMIVNTTKTVNASQVGRAQQALQMLLFERLQDPKAEVKDVFIMSISYLGLQAEDEFSRLSDGTSVNDLKPTVD